MKITRRKLAEMIEEAMGMEMVPVEMEMMGHGHSDDHGHGGADALVAVVEHKGTVSKADCCAAVMCLIECCSCPATRAKLAACCDEIMGGHHSR
jgi:hypothetical protein